MIKCQNCGALNSQESQVCGACGVRLNNNLQANAQNDCVNSTNNGSSPLNNYGNLNNNTNSVSNEQLYNNINNIREDTSLKKFEKVRKTYMLLTIVGLILSAIRIPYLLAEYKNNVFISDNIFDSILFILGILCIIFYIFTLVLNNKKKSKYVFGIISGVLSILTGNMFAVLFGVLLVIDSIVAIRCLKSNVNR